MLAESFEFGIAVPVRSCVLKHLDSEIKAIVGAVIPHHPARRQSRSEKPLAFIVYKMLFRPLFAVTHLFPSLFSWCRRHYRLMV
jgi:hypothetical protein